MRNDAFSGGRRRRARRWSGVLLAAVLVMSACGGDDDDGEAADGAGASSTTAAAGSEGGTGAGFEDQTVAMLVNFSAGGGCDTGARVLAQFLPNHLGDGANVFVHNVPGAGGLVGLNTLFNTSVEDGTTVGFVCGMLSPQALEVEGAQYQATDFHWLGALVESQVLMADESLDIATMADLAEASGVVSGGFAPDSTKDLGLKTLLNLLGTDYEHVSGYPGNADLRTALERGEINLHEETTTGFLTGVAEQVEAGTLVPLGQRGIVEGDEVVRDPALPDIPTYLELAVEVKGDEVTDTVEYKALEALIKIDSILRAVVYPPGTAEETVETMRAAVAATYEDPAFVAESESLLGAQPLVLTGEEAQETVAGIVADLDAVPEAREYLKGLATEE